MKTEQLLLQQKTQNICTYMSTNAHMSVHMYTTSGRKSKKFVHVTQRRTSQAIRTYVCVCMYVCMYRLRCQSPRNKSQAIFQPRDPWPYVCTGHQHVCSICSVNRHVCTFKQQTAEGKRTFGYVHICIHTFV